MNVSALIKQVPSDTKVQVIAMRYKNQESNAAVKKFTHFADYSSDLVSYHIFIKMLLSTFQNNATC